MYCNAVPDASSTLPSQSTGLAGFFGSDNVDARNIDLSACAHLIIDPQRYYADPSYRPRTRGTAHTLQRSENLAAATPLLRKAGLKTIIVYYESNLSTDFNYAMGGLHLVTAEKDDILIPKNQSDAFEGSNLEEVLRKHDIKNLLVSGFNTTACVFYTVQSANRNGYKTALLEDCTGQDGNQEGDIPRYISLMTDRGTQRTNSAEVLEFLQNL